MRLIITETQEYDAEFIAWLVDRLKGEIIKSINVKKLRSFDILQERLEIFKPRYPTKHHKVDFLKSVIVGIDLLKFERVKGAWIISIDKNAKHPYYFTTIYSICKFVDFGRNDVKSYPLFSKTFNRVSAQITKYYNIYLREFLLI